MIISKSSIPVVIICDRFIEESNLSLYIGHIYHTFNELSAHNHQSRSVTDDDHDDSTNNNNAIFSDAYSDSDYDNNYNINDNNNNVNNNDHSDHHRTKKVYRYSILLIERPHELQYNDYIFRILQLLPKHSILITFDNYYKSKTMNLFMFKNIKELYDMTILKIPSVLVHLNHEMPWMIDKRLFLNAEDNILSYTLSDCHDDDSRHGSHRYANRNRNDCDGHDDSMTCNDNDSSDCSKKIIDPYKIYLYFVRSIYQDYSVVLRNYYFAPFKSSSIYIPLLIPYYGFIIGKYNDIARWWWERGEWSKCWWWWSISIKVYVLT